MKVIIPVAGMGTRLRPHTYATPKTLLHVAGRPILAHILEPLVKLSGISELIFIVGDTGTQIRAYVKANYNVPATYILQAERNGLGHAISLAKERADGAPVIITLDDGILEVDCEKLIQSPYTVIGVKEVENPSAFGIVEMDGEYVARLIEKPEKPPTNLAIAGLYYIKNSNLLFECLDELIRKDIRTKGEYQLTDGLQLMLEYGEKMKVAAINWLDCGKPDALLETNRYLLTQKSPHYRRSNALIIPPVFIADDAYIENAVIGPYVSIGKGCRVSDAIIRDSVIHPNAEIQNMLLSGSIIGEAAQIRGRFNCLSIGSMSKVDWSGEV
jgi:glucose-1-phosphate thymidylyltransferase